MVGCRYIPLACWQMKKNREIESGCRSCAWSRLDAKNTRHKKKPWEVTNYRVTDWLMDFDEKPLGNRGGTQMPRDVLDWCLKKCTHTLGWSVSSRGNFNYWTSQRWVLSSENLKYWGINPVTDGYTLINAILDDMFSVPRAATLQAWWQWKRTGLPSSGDPSSLQVTSGGMLAMFNICTNRQYLAPTAITIIPVWAFCHVYTNQLRIWETTRVLEQVSSVCINWLY